MLQSVPPKDKPVRGINAKLLMKESEGERIH